MTDLASQLAVRRVLLRSAGQRIVRRRKIKPLPEPRSFALQYNRLLRARKSVLQTLLRERVYPALPDLLAEAERDRGLVRQDAARDTLSRLFGDMTLVFGRLFPDTQNELQQIAHDTTLFHAQAHQRQLKTALGVEVIQPEPFLQPVIDGFVADNVGLISSLEGQELSALEGIVSSGIRRGARVEEIKRDLQRKLLVDKSKAAFIAQDQTLKLYGELNEHRQRNVGIKSYRWSTSKDERVRPGHRSLDGTTQTWAKPPIVDFKVGRTAHPGGDFRCRCQAIPIIPDELLT